MFLLFLYVLHICVCHVSINITYLLTYLLTLVILDSQKTGVSDPGNFLRTIADINFMANVTLEGLYLLIHNSFVCVVYILFQFQHFLQ